MTGFARAEGAGSGRRWSWETRSVNGKGLEARFRLPQGLERLEPLARDMAKSRFSRGNIQASLTLRVEAQAAVSINTSQIEAYLEAGAPFFNKGLADIPRLDGLLALPGALERDETLDEAEQGALEKALLATLAEAFDQLDQARRAEGEGLLALLVGHVEEIEGLTAEAGALDAAMPAAIRERVASRFAELLPVGLPEDRLAQEAAALAVKADVREELDRLKMHIQSARELIAQGSPVGRKLDFLMQEFNREANTLCSKSADSALTRIGLAMKAAVDQLREQVQNVE
jgi:uncharacterized protein (TIGR00255 family)